MSTTLLGTAKLKYSSEGDLQIGIFKPMIEITREQVNNSALAKCTNKTVEQIKECAELLLATFFARISEVELRDVEKTELVTNIVDIERYSNGQIKEIKFEFDYID